MDSHSDPRHRWLLSPGQEALLLFMFAAAAVVGLCASATLRKKRILTEKTVEQAEGIVDVSDKNESSSSTKPADEQPASSWRVIKKVLISSILHWNEGRKLVESEKGRKTQEEMEMMGHELGGPEGCEDTTGLPLWQRRILMGERCELPRFSGLILYDERGRPVHNSSNKDASDQAKETTAGTTLKDLL